MLAPPSPGDHGPSFQRGSARIRASLDAAARPAPRSGRSVGAAASCRRSRPRAASGAATHDRRSMTRGLFVPAGRHRGLYAAATRGWKALQPRRFGRPRGAARLSPLARGATRSRGRSGHPGRHSMGAALALLAAADQPERVEKLILFSPAGLPLEKSIPRARPLHRPDPTPALPDPRALPGARPHRGEPPAALRLARTIHDLDLTSELEPLRSQRYRAPSSPAHRRARHTRPCRRLAVLLDAAYRQIDDPEGTSG